MNRKFDISFDTLVDMCSVYGSVIIIIIIILEAMPNWIQIEAERASMTLIKYRVRLFAIEIYCCHIFKIHNVIRRLIDSDRKRATVK